MGPSQAGWTDNNPNRRVCARGFYHTESGMNLITWEDKESHEYKAMNLLGRITPLESKVQIPERLAQVNFGVWRKGKMSLS